MHLGIRSVALLIAMLCSAAARAERIDMAWGGQGRFERRVNLAPGQCAGMQRLMRDKARRPRHRRLSTMRALRRHRGWLCGWLIALVLFSQLATAAYACPQLAPAPADAVAAMAAMPDCDGSMPASMDPDQPQLCKAHCEVGKTSVNSQVTAPDAPPALAVGAALVGIVDGADAAQLAARMPASVADGPPIGSPPLYLSLLVLRN